MHKNELGSYQFDIKETVHLSHQQLPIEEVEEMELIPQIEIAENGEEIEISGSLYLFGDYKGNQKAGKLETADDLPESYEESVQFEPLSAERGPFSPLAREDRFEYRIPVKITLPRGRVREVEDVYAYINAFDYELISPYQIDVRASLVIAGFTEKQEEVIRPQENEQFEFVHIAGQQSIPEPEDSFTQRLKAVEQQAEDKEEREEAKEVEIEPRTNTTLEIPPLQETMDEPETQEEPSRTPAGRLDQEEESSAEDEEASQEDAQEGREPKSLEDMGNVIPLPLSAGESSAEEESEDEEEEEDVRVAISTKGTRQDREPISSLSSIFGRIPKPRERVAEAAEERLAENQDQEEEEENKDKEALYLTNFMENQEEKFTKVKICILQKNETLEEVADRYAISIESILRANNTARNQVGAGQLLYIPVKG